MTAGFGGGIDPADAATGLVNVMDGVKIENSGTFWNAPTGKVYAW